MITSANINNFRCFQTISLNQVGKINIIVGDNSAGKTALLEALFIALCGSTELAFRYRNQRGFDPVFSGMAVSIEDSLVADLFYNRDVTNSISIKIDGSGVTKRTLNIIQNNANELTLTMPNTGTFGATTFRNNAIRKSPITFSWQNYLGQTYDVDLLFEQNQIQFGSTPEVLSQSFFFPSTQAVGSIDSATRYSEISKKNKHKKFNNIINRNFPTISDLSIEFSGGTPCIHATVANINERIPLPNVSGAINRLVSIFLAITAAEDAVVFVDEMENGIYYKNYPNLWRTIIDLCNENSSQLFLTTHSLEWISSLRDIFKSNEDDLVFWRLEKSPKNEPMLTRLNGRSLMAGIEIGGEVR
jgi:AAA15 family ATPase/GTPase